MTHRKKGGQSKVNMEKLAVEHLLGLQATAAKLEKELEILDRQAARWEASRWGRASRYGKGKPRRNFLEKARVSAGAARILLGGSPASEGVIEDVQPRAEKPGKVKPTSKPSATPPCVEEGVARRAARLAAAMADGRELTAAAIMDPFTRQAFDAECRIVDLHPESWQQELIEATPDLLFIESAWRGHRESWFDTVQHMPRELVEIVGWCRANDVPTVFWNKEDPVYYDRYIKVAGLFDHVFTTDIESVSRYMKALGHQRVHVLPFAAQPLLCNPIQAVDRKPAAIFAGSYYPGFKQRNIDLFAQFEGVGRVMPVEIFDRNLNSENDIFRWPAPFNDLVVGTLGADQIDIAYKGYQLALNVNTVTGSQTMLARRAFDLLASGTPTISNYSRSIKVLFGDLLPASNDPDRIEELARQVVEDPDTVDKRRVMGVRHILRNHTYGERWRHVLATVSGVSSRRPMVRLGLVGLANELADVARWTELAAGQTQAFATLVIVSDDEAVVARCQAEKIDHLTSAEAADVSVSSVFGEVDAVAHLSPENWYGPHYLEGLLGGLTYSTALATAKVTRFRTSDGEAIVVDPGQEFRRCTSAHVPWSRAMVRAEGLGETRVAELIGGFLPAAFEVVSIDRFDFAEACPDGQAPGDGLSADLPLRVGATSEQIPVESVVGPEFEVPASAFPVRTRFSAREGCEVYSTDAGVVVGWSLPGKQATYLPFRERIRVADVAIDGALYLESRTSGVGRLGVNVSWRNKAGKRIPGITYPADKVNRIDVPEGATYIDLFLTMGDSGARVVQSITLAGSGPRAPQMLEGWASPILLVTDAYPAYGDFYRNGFVHTRVKGYRERGHDVTVFVLRPNVETSYREYQGVNVITGSPDILQELLATGHFDHILVHFLNQFMWPVLSRIRGQVPITVFVHGYEVQPYWRREFNYGSEAERKSAIALSEKRMQLWREVAASASEDVDYVFVSHVFREQAMSDFRSLGFELPAGSTEVISNPVNTTLFPYVEKDPELRKKILLIRPFVSRTYATDLAVAAVVALSSEPWFSELSVRVIGDGVLFDEDTAPLRGMPNVEIERRFLPQSEIAKLHREFGVFLVPTRQDTQGVSRDEAMSSGLVPVTTGIPVISEFLSEEEGYIAPPEDADGLADAIRHLYHHPEAFVAKSRAAAARIRRTVASSIVIPQEIALFRPTRAATDNRGGR